MCYIESTSGAGPTSFVCMSKIHLTSGACEAQWRQLSAVGRWWYAAVPMRPSDELLHCELAWLASLSECEFKCLHVTLLGDRIDAVPELLDEWVELSTRDLVVAVGIVDVEPAS